MLPVMIYYTYKPLDNNIKPFLLLGLLDIFKKEQAVSLSEVLRKVN